MTPAELAAAEQELAWLDMTDGVAENLAQQRKLQAYKRAHRAAARRFRTEVEARERKLLEQERRRRKLRRQFLKFGPRHDGSPDDNAKNRNESIRKQLVWTRNWKEQAERAERKRRMLKVQRTEAFEAVAKNEKDILALMQRKQQRLQRLSCESKIRVKQEHMKRLEKQKEERRTHRLQWIQQREQKLSRTKTARPTKHARPHTRATNRDAHVQQVRHLRRSQTMDN